MCSMLSLSGFGRQHVQIGDQEEALELILKLQAVAMAANEVTQMQFSCGPISGKNSLSFAHKKLLWEVPGA